ncbi:hypothetical protein RJ640_001067 [Escallonia rubra]|uniref:Uncharacterized protein n=1 Tax=Escallonia rubra TaxID=112253 RepID=A0AA88QHQ8_9ASTE|nr:hypothetical protein RJ640_001067 [Escallonia rubra]
MADTTKIGLALGIKGELNKLKGTLSTVKAVLVDAEGLQETKAVLSVWLEALKDVCYAIDDILDEYDVIDLQQKVNQRSIQSKVRNILSRSNPRVFRFRMDHKNKAIREKLDQIAAYRHNFHLPHVERSLLPHWQRETHSSVIASNVIGRDHDRDLLVEKLVKVADDKGVAVIPILGIGGLGKTTLAKLVYNDERVVKYFDLRKWVCVSDEFDVKKIIGNIVVMNNLTLEHLQQHLRQNLSARRYLLILDDVWNEDLRKWRELRDLLLCGAPGSKIVVTTRSQSVVSTLDPIYIHKLIGLSDKESLFLLMELALGKGQMERHHNLKTIGEQIVRKCKGVPLAITTLGSLLHMNTQANDWCSVRDNAIWKLQQTATDILPALKLSYNHLPPHLKRCFAICAIFPKDHEFCASQLIGTWMALGLLGSRDQVEEGDDIGKKYFIELCSRSFFQDVKDSSWDTEFSMHDLMHDLALSIIGSESLILIKDSPMVPNQKFSPMVPNQKFQHVYFSMQRNDFFPSSLLQLRKLQTVITLRGCSQSFVDTCVSRFKCLRILDLSDSIFETLPRSIGGLKHLKYLDIRWNANLNSLPRSLCKLQGLQTLHLMGCRGLTKLPRDFGNLISLRWLSLTTQETFLPVNVFQRLTCLRTLECIPRGLRILIIFNCPNLGSSPGLPYLTSLVGLVIAGCDKLDLNMDEESIREHGGGLTSLQLLFIYSLPNLVTFPQWLVPSAANTLKHLALSKCENLTTLPEDLNALQKLSIYSCPNCLEWLDKQEPNSIIGLSLRTTTSLTDEQIQELALGLEESEQRFTWGTSRQVGSESLRVEFVHGKHEHGSTHSSMAYAFRPAKKCSANNKDWSKTVRIYMRSIDKDDHLSSDPPTDDTKRLWLREDARLILQIRNSIDSEILGLINHCEFVKELMDYLEFLYSGKGNISRIYDVCRAFYRPEKETKTLTTFFMDFKKTYEEWNMLLPFSKDIKVQQAQREQMAAMSFLGALPPEFDTAKSQILSGTDITSLQEVFSQVLRT